MTFRTVCLCLVAAVFFLGSYQDTFATTYTVDIYAHVAGCGDELIQTGEECDGGNLGGTTCESVGFDEGTVSCSSVCTLITSSCVLNEKTEGGTRIGRDDLVANVTDTNVVVSGFAAPSMSVALLKDGQRIATVPTKPDGSFQITVTGLSGGVYRMQVVAEDVFMVAKSELFEVRVLKNSTTKISGVRVPPAMRIVTEGDTVRILGKTIPNTTVILMNEQHSVAVLQSNQNGEYVFIQDASKINGKNISVVITGSDYAVSSIEELYVTAVEEPGTITSCGYIADTNNDCHVDVIDFFIMRWRFFSSLVVEKYDFNRDGSVTIVDFSILAYYWTG